jgi:putative transposase
VARIWRSLANAWLRIARTRGKNFLPCGLEKFERRAADIAMLIREAFLRGVSTRQVGRIVATVTGEPVSAQTVFKLTGELDEAVRQFHSVELKDEWAYLFLDGVSLRIRRPSGRKRVQMLVAYGVKQDGTRHLLAFQRSTGESQQAWEGLLQDLYRRGLTGKQLQLVITDGCPGLAAALEVVYPRVLHQRCWVHKMRNILEKARKRDYDDLKAGAQAIYLAGSAREARELFRRFREKTTGRRRGSSAMVFSIASGCSRPARTRRGASGTPSSPERTWTAKREGPGKRLPNLLAGSRFRPGRFTMQ